ncbi:MAG: hypothetical protein ABSF90_24740 [Syntrophobacteraceae bacterium]
MRRHTALFLFAFALVLMAGQLADCEDVCDEFPIPTFEEGTKVTGVYQNWDYGYEVRLPAGIVGYCLPAPAPNHEFGIVISRSPKAYVWVDASYWPEEEDSLGDIVDTHIGWVCDHGKDCELEQRSIRRFAGLEAEKFIVRYTCPQSGSIVKEEQTLALRKDIVYTVGLISAPETYQKAKGIADRIRRSWDALSWLKFDRESEKRLQEAVDKGHQPWRLEAACVAHVAALAMDKSVAYNSCNLIYETELDSIVQCREKRNYAVHLRRLFKKDGIWTATGVKIGK